MSVIEITGHTVVIRELIISRSDVADFLASVPEDDREGLAREAFEVGVFCLERARGGKDMDFVRRQVESLLTTVENAVRLIPQATEEKLLAKLGTGDGQVLAPVQVLVQQVERGTQQQLREVRELLANEIDPSKESSSLAKALKKMTDLLDVDRTDSIQGRMDAAVRTVSAVDGALATSVKATVAESIQPLVEELRSLSLIVNAQKATVSALANTTAKGTPFEDEVVERLQRWGWGFGLEVAHCGGDNQAGDLIVTLRDPLSGASLSIAIECKDHGAPSGRKPIADAMLRAMTQRESTRAIYLSRNPEGLAKEIGEWAEGTTAAGPWVATTFDNLFTAVRFSIAMDKVERVKDSQSAVDAEALLAQASRVRDSLKRIATMQRHATVIRSSADAVSDEASNLRSEVGDALRVVEESLATLRQAEAA